MLVPSISSILNVTTPTQKLALTSTVVATTVIGASQVLIVSTQPARLTFDGTAPMASSFYLPANAMVIVAITPGQVVTTVRDSVDGSIYITGVN